MSGSRVTAGVVLAAVVAGVFASVIPGHLQAQRRSSSAEAAVLRQAVTFETAGRFDEARRILESLLDRNPTSSAGLFALERVLRAQDRLADVLPRVDAYLDEAPRSNGVRQLHLSVLAEVDSTDAIEPAIHAWIDAEPRSPEPFHEGARILDETFGPERAISLLERGRAALPGEGTLGLDLGERLLRTGRATEAAEAWAAAVGEDEGVVADVLRRMADLGDARRAVARSLVSALDREPTSLSRRRTAVRIALETGWSGEALRLAKEVGSDLEASARRAFLSDLSGEAREARAADVELWALRSLRDLTVQDTERLALDQKIVEAALSAGDTATAVAARRRLADGYPRDSAERRGALADLLRMEVQRGDTKDVLRRLEAFRAEFPDAPELDGLASAVAAGLRARQQEDQAVQLLAGVEGPRSALERAYLLFEAGDVAEGRASLMAALPGLTPDEATGVIQLSSLLDRLGPVSAGRVAESAAQARRGRHEQALTTVGEGVAAAPPEERAALLSHGARIAASAGLEEEAAGLRRRVVTEHPDAPESAEAAFLLALYRAGSPEGVAEAVSLLESLIVMRPNSPVVPAARRELERLGGGS